MYLPVVCYTTLNIYMKFNEFANRPKSPEQQRIDSLKTTKDRAAQALTAERNRQHVAKAQKTLANASISSASVQ